MITLLKIHPKDNVAVAFNEIGQGATVGVEGDDGFVALAAIPVGHKVSLRDLRPGQAVIKYGAIIGLTTRNIRKGELVHTDNLKTGLSKVQAYTYQANFTDSLSKVAMEEPSLEIYRRSNGKVGIRNEIWVIPIVGCVNGVAASIVQKFRELNPDCSAVDGVYFFPHPYGCSQWGEDHERTKLLLQNMALHPNAGGALVVGLGCENNQIGVFEDTMPESFDPERILFLEAQSVEDEVMAGMESLRKLYVHAAKDRRVPGTWSDIVVRLECGGSDAFSGITANPLIGHLSDYIVERDGTAVLTEVPEMFGAEHFLMRRCVNRTVFENTVEMINSYKNFYIQHNQPVYENPSPGNKKGGITTLEEKSLGCTQKAGSSKVVDIVKIEERVKKKGLNLLYAPGNDIVATTALGTTGCHLVLFSTGRGTPLGGFIPTVKIASNSNLSKRKPHWIDFDAGQIADSDVDYDTVFASFLNTVVEVINGQPTSAEMRDNREIAILKTGVTL